MTQPITLPSVTASQKNEMIKYGITRISDDMFHYRKHSFKNFESAVSHAKHAFETPKEKLMRLRESTVDQYPVESHRISFIHPFNLIGVSGVQKPGTYSVETQKKAGTFVNNLYHQNLTTWITLRQGSGVTGLVETIEVDGLDLEEALEKDKSVVTEI